MGANVPNDVDYAIGETHRRLDSNENVNPSGTARHLVKMASLVSRIQTSFLELMR